MYWVGGTGNWNDPAKWATSSGGAGGVGPPTNVTDAVFDNNSVPAGQSFTVNLPLALVVCANFSVSLTGSRSVTFNHPGNDNIVLLVAGNAEILSPGAVTATTLKLSQASSVSNVWSLNDCPIGQFSQTSVGTTSFISGLTCRRFALTGDGNRNVSFSLNGNVLTCDEFVIPNTTGIKNIGTSGTGTRNIRCGRIEIASPNVNFTTPGATMNFILTESSGEVLSNSNVSLPNLYIAASNYQPTDEIQVSNLSVAGNLSIATASQDGVRVVRFLNSALVGGNIAVSGIGQNRRVMLTASSSSATATITCNGSMNIANLDALNISAAGGSSPWSPANGGDCGGNSNINFPSGKTVYWNSASSQFGGGWATSPGGTAALANFPLAQDTAIIDVSSSVPPSGINLPYFNLGHFNITDTAPTVSINGSPRIYGSLHWGLNASFDSSIDHPPIMFAGAGAMTFTDNRSASQPYNRGINLWRGSTTFVSPNKQVIDLGDKPLLFSALSAADLGGKDVMASYMAAGVATTISNSSGEFYLSGSSGVSVVVSSSFDPAPNITLTAQEGPVSISNNSGSLGRITIAGENNTSGVNFISTNGSFADIVNERNVPYEITFTNNSSLTFSQWSLSGKPGAMVSLNRVSIGSFSLTKTGPGIVNSDWLNISNSNALPGSDVWYAGNNSVDGGNNTGWIFNAPVPPSSGNNFLIFFGR